MTGQDGGPGGYGRPLLLLLSRKAERVYRKTKRARQSIAVMTGIGMWEIGHLRTWETGRE